MLSIIIWNDSAEWIADVSTDPATGIIVAKNPCIIKAEINNDSGRVNADLFPTALFAKNRTVYLDPNAAIRGNAEPSEEITRAYNDRFGTQVIAPPEKKIIHG